jgi:ribose 5-phosphate isomerase B
MRIAVGSDERTSLTDAVVEELRGWGGQVELDDALAPGDDPDWPVVAQRVARRVAEGMVDQGLLFCWTGTGVSMAANKVPGVRAALCGDAVTAAGARRCNDTNLLCLSLRLTSSEVAREILDARLSAAPEESEQANIQRLYALDRQRLPEEPLAIEGPDR